MTKNEPIVVSNELDMGAIAAKPIYNRRETSNDVGKVISSDCNYQDLLKCIALAATIIDHLGLYVFYDAEWMRLVGRSAMPIFCFFAGYNFHSKPSGKIFAFGIAMVMVFSLYVESHPASILTSIWIGQAYIYLFRQYLTSMYMSCIQIVILSLLYFHTHAFFEYGTLAAAIMLIGFITKHKLVSLLSASIATIILSTLHSMYIFKFNLLQIGIESSVVLLLMIARSPTAITMINFKPISRHSLFIYFAHLWLIVSIWYFNAVGVINWY